MGVCICVCVQMCTCVFKLELVPPTRHGYAQQLGQWALWPSLDPGAAQPSWRAEGLSSCKPWALNRVDIPPPPQRFGEDSVKTDAGQTLKMQIFYLKLLDRKGLGLPGGLLVLAYLWDTPIPSLLPCWAQVLEVVAGGRVLHVY